MNITIYNTFKLMCKKLAFVVLNFNLVPIYCSDNGQVYFTDIGAIVRLHEPIRDL